MSFKRIANRFLEHWNGFLLILLGIFIGVSTKDAFTGGEDFTKHWLIIIFVYFPLFMVGSWAITKNKKGGR